MENAEDRPVPQGAAPRLRSSLSGLRLDEVTGRLAEISTSRDQLHNLLDAVIGVARGLELSAKLRSVVEAAVALLMPSTARSASSVRTAR